MKKSVAHLLSLWALGLLIVCGARSAHAGPARHGSFPSASPDGAHIVFASSRDAVIPPGKSAWFYMRIYIMDADGSNVHAVTTANTSDTAPVWSADGKWIVFGTSDAATDQGSLQIINPDGTGRRTLVTGHLLPWARVSPDSRRIMFTKTEASGASIWIVNIDGTDLRQLATGLKASWDGIWSPDGSRIVFAEAPDLNESSPAKESKIYIAAANGDNRRLLASYPGLIQVPSWSPDGRSIAYQTYTGVKGEADIVLLDVRSGRFRTVTHRASPYLDECPAWLPDGRLLFQSTRSGAFEVYVMNADGSDAHALTRELL